MVRGTEPLRVLIAGGGVAALEAVLALRALAEERVDLTVLAPQEEFEYRPLAVAEPFAAGEVHRFGLESIAKAVGARLVRGTLLAVDPEAKVVTTGRGGDLPYDVLLVAVGALQREAVAGAVTFRGPADVHALRNVFDDAVTGAVRSVVFALPGGPGWPLPLYELALLMAYHLEDAGALNVEVSIVTHEEEPLALFGPTASEAVRELLEAHEITVHTANPRVEVGGGRLRLTDGSSVEADAVVALPRLTGPRVAGLPQDEDGFIPTDEAGRVEGVVDVYAAGDATSFPVKQGGLAAQQADAAAHAIAADAGAPVTPEPFRPVLRGLLLTGGVPRYLRAVLDSERETSTVSTEPLWWPPGKIAGRHLSAFLAARTGLSIAPAPAGSEALPVEVDLGAPVSGASPETID